MTTGVYCDCGNEMMLCSSASGGRRWHWYGCRACGHTLSIESAELVDFGGAAVPRLPMHKIVHASGTAWLPARG